MLFSVPENEKITDRQLQKVLISSVCTILLCLGCLVGSTWAWFTVSVENNGNILKIAEPAADLSVGSESYQGEVLGSGTYDLKITLDLDTVSKQDSFGVSRDVYVVLTFLNGQDNTVLHTGFVTVNAHAPEDTASLTVNGSLTVKITKQILWPEPENCDPLGSTVTLGTASTETTGAAESTETTGAAESTETTGAAESTEATGATEAAETTAATESTEATQATEAETQQ